MKRGNFLLENILGTPTPPPPPDIPALEEALKGIKDREPTMREVMEVHRADAMCAACHNRMDPLGLAFENYNAMGIWRDQEKKQPIDASGKLVTGRTFKDARELKQILRTEYKLDVYRCLTEKMMTYALGRGPEYQDVETVDQVVDRVEREGGKLSSDRLWPDRVESLPEAPGTGRDRLLQDPPHGSETMSLNELNAEAIAEPGPFVLQPPPLPPRLRRRDRPAGPRIDPAPSGINAAHRRGDSGPGHHQTTGAPLRMAVVYVPNGVNQKTWWPTGEGDRLRAQQDDGAAGALEGEDPGLRRPRPHQRHRRQGRTRRPRPGQQHVPDRSPDQEDRRGRHPRRRLGRPAHRPEGSATRPGSPRSS